MAWPVVAGMVMSAAGSAAAGNAANSAATSAANSTVEGAQMNAVLQKWLREQDAARMKPFVDLGTSALPELEQRRLGKFDTMSDPYASMRTGMLDSGMAAQMALRGGGNSSYGMRNALQNLGAEEEANGYQRVLDRVRIGQGSAAQAGSQGQQYANALSSAYQTAGNINSALTNSLANQRQQLYGDVMNTAAGIPAANYLYNQRKQISAMNRDRDYFSDSNNAPTSGYIPANPRGY